METQTPSTSLRHSWSATTGAFALAGGALHAAVEWHYPIGRPNSGIICGTGACHNPGIVWLTAQEATEYGNEKGVPNYWRPHGDQIFRSMSFKVAHYQQH